MSEPTIDDRIITTLQQPCTSHDAALVLADAQKALAEATSKAESAEAASFNPMLPTADAQTQRAAANDLRFAADRLDAQVAALEVRVSKLAEAETAAEHDARRAAVVAERDALAADIAKVYPLAVRLLTGLAKRIADNDRALADVGLTHFGDRAETIGRGLPVHGYFGKLGSIEGPGRLVSAIRDIKLQLPDDWHLAWYDDGPRGWVYPGLDCAPTDAEA